MNRVIRYRLLTILVLGVLTSALSVLALVQLLTTSTVQRVERARDAVVEEVDRLAKAPAQLTEPARTSLIGMHAGVSSGGENAADEITLVATGLPEPVLALVRTAVQKSATSRDRVILETPAPEGTVVVAAKPIAQPETLGMKPGSTVFVTYLVRPMASLRTWQRIVGLLGAATALLVATAVYSVVTMNRGASALRGSLRQLASDLEAPVPRPSVRELDGIADGIAELARKLAAARVKEERLARELAQNERLAALGRVAAGVAHEVRNPLASIKLRLDLAAATGGPLPEGAQAAITHATSEIQRLDRLVADLLVVAGRSLGPKVKTDLADLVQERIDALAPWTAEHGVGITVRGSGHAEIDVDSTSRAIDNLLRNAVEASSRGADVEVTVELRGAQVAVDVEDRGRGVDAARVAELFEPFFTTKPSGTGLGLAISRAIAQSHEGDVLYAREGDATRFSLVLATSRGVGA